MSKLSGQRRSTISSVMLLASLLATNVWAQAPSGGSNALQGDPFDQLHVALSSAADNILAAPAQRQPDTKRESTSAKSSEAKDALKISLPVGSREKAWRRLTELRPIIEPILREEGVPVELAAVVLVESGGQPTALSPKGARGIWQFMPDTARRYGLAVDASTDERIDVQKSTSAAARYLRYLYQRFGNWELALAAYNAGENAVDTAAGRARSNKFTLIGSWLPLETRDYVPAVLGAMAQLSAAQPRPFQRSSGAYVLYAAVTVN